MAFVDALTITKAFCVYVGACLLCVGGLFRPWLHLLIKHR